MWRDDHAHFWDNAFKAIEITEDGCTPHMHKPTDTPERLDYDNIAKIVHGLHMALSQEQPPRRRRSGPPSRGHARSACGLNAGYRLALARSAAFLKPWAARRMIASSMQ